MGYWFDRKDPTWNVARLELPSAAVVIYQDEVPLPAELECPSDTWTNDPVEGMRNLGMGNLWVRTLDEVPRFGSSLSEHYRQFFLDAFHELKDALGPG